jgi:hypothetical protein
VRERDLAHDLKRFEGEKASFLVQLNTTMGLPTDMTLQKSGARKGRNGRTTLTKRSTSAQMQQIYINECNLFGALLLCQELIVACGAAPPPTGVACVYRD